VSAITQEPAPFSAALDELTEEVVAIALAVESIRLRETRTATRGR
jgi:hypothetical protein